MKQEDSLPIVDDWLRAGHVTKFWPIKCQESLLLGFLGRNLLLLLLFPFIKLQRSALGGQLDGRM